VKMTVGAAGRAAIDEVWDRYIHPQRWSEWSPQISSVDCTDDIIRAGSTGTVHGPCRIGVEFNILQVDHEKRCWSWRVWIAFVTLELMHSVQAGSPGSPARAAGSSTSLDISGPAPVVLGYAPIARLALGRLVR